MIKRFVHDTMKYINSKTPNRLIVRGCSAPFEIMQKSQVDDLISKTLKKTGVIVPGD